MDEGRGYFMDLKILVRNFMAAKQRRLTAELASKYAAPEEEVLPQVSLFLDNTYGPCARLAASIAASEGASILFIARAGCVICERTRPLVSDFAASHEGLALISIDYDSPEGLLYHILHDEGSGMLPMVALICRGEVRAVFTGEGAAEETLEDCCGEIAEECGQNIYAL